MTSHSSTLDQDDAVSELLVDALVARHEQLQPRELAPTRHEFSARPSQRRTVRKVALIAVCGLTVSGLGVQRTAQWAKNRNGKQDSLTEVAGGVSRRATEPRFLLTAPGYVAQDFSRVESFDENAYVQIGYRGVHAFVQVKRNSSLPPMPSDTSVYRYVPVQVGSHAGYTKIAGADSWGVLQWASGNDVFSVQFVQFDGALSADVLRALGDLSMKADGSFDLSKLPDDVAADVGPTSGYEVRYGKKPASDEQLAVPEFQLSVSSGGLSRLGNRSIIARAGRQYVVDDNRGSVRWEEDGSTLTLFRYSGDRDREALLRMADTVRRASSAKWFRALRSGHFQMGLEGLVEGKVDAMSWNFLSDTSESSDGCVEVIFSWSDQDRADCVRPTESLISLARAEVVNGVPVVYGTTDGKSADSYAVRVTDADGDVVGEEVTKDQTSFPGRAFAFPLDEESVGPLTIELFNFERERYVNNYRDDPETPYVNPEADPLASVEVKLPKQ